MPNVQRIHNWSTIVLHVKEREWNRSECYWIEEQIKKAFHIKSFTLRLQELTLSQTFIASGAEILLSTIYKANREVHVLTFDISN